MLHSWTARWITWRTLPSEWGPGLWPNLGECQCLPSAGYPHAGIEQSLQTLVGVLGIGCWKLSACHGMTSWAGAACWLAIWVVAVACGHPSALGCWQWSSSMSSVGPAVAAFSLGGLCWSRWCDLHSIGGWDVFQNFFISECSQGLHHTSKLQHTSHQLVRLTWGWWLGFFHPILEGLCIGQGLLWPCQLEVLTAKLHILEGQESVPV